MSLTLPNPRTQEREVAPCSLPAVRYAPSERRYEAPAAVRLWHLASLDAPSVAAVWSLGFAWVAGVRLPMWVLALQVLVVWVVYVGDRLLDARVEACASARVDARAGLRQYGDELRERHFFHWRHRRVLAPMAVLGACAAAAIVLRWMPVGARERDSVLAVASLAYFTRVHTGTVRRVFSKELLVGVLFTVGCALPAWPHASLRVLGVPVAFFAALAWLNCQAIERWETDALFSLPHFRRKKDERMGRGALSAIWQWGLWAGGCGVGLAILLAAWEPRAAALLAAGAVSALLLAWLDGARGRLSAVTLRAAADLVLLAPGILLMAVWLVWR